MNDTKVGLACFNTAWRSTGEPDNIDNKSLLLGERAVDLAAESMGEVDISLAILHHPLDLLAEFDQATVESRLNTEFDIILFGHLHRPRPEGRKTPQGTSAYSQCGCVYQNRDYFNGYQYIKVDLPTRKLEFIVRNYYDKPRRQFDKALNIARDGSFIFSLDDPHGTSRVPRVEEFLALARPYIRARANRHISLTSGPDAPLTDIKDLFVCPPLATRPEYNMQAREGLEKGEQNEVLPEELLKDKKNYMIIGTRESGKSCLAHFLAVRVSEGIWDKPQVPVIVDFAKLKTSSYSLKRTIRGYYEEHDPVLDIDEHLEHGDFFLIVDNFDISDESKCKSLKKFIRDFPHN